MIRMRVINKNRRHGVNVRAVTQTRNASTASNTLSWSVGLSAE
jgi:hypothetical protein